MTRLINHLPILLLVITTVAFVSGAQTERVIARIAFEGLQQIKAEEALATSGLKTDQPFKVEAVDEAAQRLLDSGIFKQVGYRTTSVGNRVTITFHVEEASSGDSPVIFDNFIWFTDEQLKEAVRREVPTFAGRAPNVGKMPETITRVLRQLLADKKIPGTVEYAASQDLAGHVLGHVFSVTGIKMPICTLHFPGAENVSEAKLAETAKELSDADYSNERIRVFSGMKLFALYREVGQMRAKFGAPIAKPDPRCKNGVDVTIPVVEGLIYSWGPTVWSGATALTTDQLSQALGVKEGTVANGLKFDQGITAIVKAYGRQGYLETRVRPTPEFDDGAKIVTYKIDVSEGQQYHMGSLLFKGLAERDAKALRDSWTLRRGEIFDQGYLAEFFKNDSRSAMQRLAEERQALGKPAPRLEMKLSPNKQSLTVDVSLELAN